MVEHALRKLHLFPLREGGCGDTYIYIYIYICLFIFVSHHVSHMFLHVLIMLFEFPMCSPKVFLMAPHLYFVWFAIHFHIKNFYFGEHLKFQCLVLVMTRSQLLKGLNVSPNWKQRKNKKSGHVPWFATLWRGKGVC